MTDIPAMEFIDNPHAPDVYADNVSGVFIFNGNIRITFESLRVNHKANPGPMNRVVIGRLVMPIMVAESMARGLLDFIEKHKAQPASEAQAGPTIQ